MIVKPCLNAGIVDIPTFAQDNFVANPVAVFKQLDPSVERVEAFGASSPFQSAPPSPSALESPIASLPPAERHLEPSASASSLPVTEISSEDDLTAIERKITMMQRKAPAKYSEPNEPDDREKQLGLTEGEELDGYRLLGVSCIEALVSALLCPECAGSSLKLSETGKGVLLAFVVSCPTCGEVARAPHSVNIGDTRQNDLAARIGLSSRDCGVSFTKLTHLFTGMNMPPPICLKTSQKVAAKVHDAATAAAGNVMRTAAQSVRKRENAKEGELLDVCEPRHVGCPTGTDSWCPYNRSKALEAAGEPPAFRPHKSAFSKEIAREMTVECAVALAVLEFNLGPRGIEEALLEMGIQPGSYQASYGERATKMKVAKAQVKALESFKKSHKKRKMEAVAKAQRDRAEEGVTYAPGAF
ncbi:hypothetical protein HPB47_023127 [Ixodes persulcatus]|uniref:Uncharacterized protein n=1 Tax=Ixodes persulcatus TaxID=34615 RepID=A0AC60Q8P0_IXOPE|nr:hypothetical protein HPB47_023127 [Ixodes persulcatus]